MRNIIFLCKKNIPFSKLSIPNITNTSTQKNKKNLLINFIQYNPPNEFHINHQKKPKKVQHNSTINNTKSQHPLLIY